MIKTTLKYKNIPKVIDSVKSPTMKICSTKNIKQNKKDVQIAKSVNSKKNISQRSNTHSSQRQKMFSKIRRSEKLIGPLVLNPYKLKMKIENRLHDKQNLVNQVFVEKRPQKKSNSMPKACIGTQKENLNLEKKTTQNQNLNKFKKGLKDYLVNKLDNGSKIEKKNEIRQLNTQQNQFMDKCTKNQEYKKREIIDKIKMKGKYKTIITPLFVDQKYLQKNPQNLNENYWNNVFQSDVSYRSETQFNESLLAFSFLKTLK